MHSRSKLEARRFSFSLSLSCESDSQAGEVALMKQAAEGLARRFGVESDCRQTLRYFKFLRCCGRTCTEAHPKVQ